MSEENIDKLRRAYASLNGGDYEDAVSIVHPDVEFSPPGAQPTYRGVASVRKWMEPDAFEEQVFELLEFATSGSRVLVKQRVWGRGAGSGIEVEVESWAVWTFDEDGLAIRIEGFMDYDET